MRLIAAIALLISLTPSFAQKHEGKTCTEILKMGHDRWFDFYTGRIGESTASMTNASGIYGDCLKKRNEDRLKKLPKSDSEWVRKQHKAAKAVTTLLLSLEARDGGTMYNIVAALNYVSEQEAVSKLIGIVPKAKTSTANERQKQARTISQIRANLKHVEQIIGAEKDYARLSGFNRAHFVKWSKDAQKAFEVYTKALEPERAKANLVLLDLIYDAALPQNFKEPT